MLKIKKQINPAIYKTYYTEQARKMWTKTEVLTFWWAFFPNWRGSQQVIFRKSYILQLY